MSKYTMELRKVMLIYGEEDVKSWFTNYDLNDYLTQEEIDVINERGTWNKEKLAQLILDKYYMREIGFETPALFKHYARVKMQEVMEEKLPLIYSASIKYNPLINVDYTEEFTRSIDNNGDAKSISSSNKITSATNNGSSNNTTSNTNVVDKTTSNNSSGLTVQSDTPQGQISKTSILAGDYASSTSAGESENTIDEDGTITDNGTNNTITSDTLNSNDNITSNVNNTNSNKMIEGSTKTIKGNSGVSATSQKMIQLYRDNIRAINKEIVEELSDLFMGLW